MQAGLHAIVLYVVLQPNSPQLASSLISLQSGLLSHTYSIRIHVPSPHLCSSGMQGLSMGLTKRDAEGRDGGCWSITDVQSKATLQAMHYTTVNSQHKRNRSQVEKQQHPGTLNCTESICFILTFLLGVKHRRINRLDTQTRKTEQGLPDKTHKTRPTDLN